MNFSKLFLMMALGVSLNNAACGMNHNNEKKIYNNKASQELGNIDIYSDSNKIRLLLEDNANPNIKNKYGWTPLHMAAYKGSKECVQHLINKGAHVNAKDEYDQTPLHIAACNGKTACVELLLDQGSDVNAKDDNGRTLLHWAAQNGHKECVERIINFIVKISDGTVKQLEYQCSIDKVFRKKCQIFLISNKRKLGALKIPKPLYCKILVQSCQFITELVNAKDNNGETALDWARKRNNEEIVTLLEPYEKKEVN